MNVRSLMTVSFAFMYVYLKRKSNPEVDEVLFSQSAKEFSAESRKAASAI